MPGIDIARIAQDVTSLLGFWMFFSLLTLVAHGYRGFRLSPGQRAETRTNLAIVAFDAFFTVPLLIALGTGLSAMQRGFLGDFADTRGIWLGMPAWLVMVMAVLAGDLAGYWRHRLQHTAPLWPAHATHHSDEAFGWLTLLRMHPLDRVSTYVIDSALLMVLGFPIEAVLVNGTVRHGWGFFIHANVPWRLGPIGKILISPAAHRVHHIRQEALSGTNYATVFTFWDRAFGTWSDPRGLECCDTGIESGSLGFAGEMARPVGSMVKALRRNAKFA